MKRTTLLHKLSRSKRCNVLIITLIIVLIIGMMGKENIPVLKNIFSMNEDINLEQYEDYLEVVGKSKESGNITVTLESAVADRNILMLSFLVKNDNEEIKDLKDADVHISSLTINGREMCLISKNNIELIDHNEARIVKRINWDYDSMPENLNVSVGIERMFNIEGNWNIRFNVDTAKVLKDTYEEKIDSRINFKDLKGTIKEVTISPLTIKIDSIYKSYKKSGLEFLVLNEDDEELMIIDENTSTNLNQYEYTAQYVSNEPLEKLNIIPIYCGKSKGEILTSNKINLDEFHQFYLNINDNLAVKILDCSYDGKYVVVKYNYEYRGKTISADLNRIYVKSNKVIYDEEADNIKKNYYCSEYKCAVFECGNLENLEIGCYDGGGYLLLEDYAFEVEKPEI